MQRLLVLIAVALISAGFSFYPPSLFFQSSPKRYPETTIVAADTVSGAQEEDVFVKRTIDGDTIELGDGRRIRYIGIDTPELVHPKKSVECFGREAKEANANLIEGKTIRLKKDVSETDQYGRLLRYVYAGNTMVNDYLVRQGYALASSYPPDVAFQDEFRQAQEEARENNRGLWESCPTVDIGKRE